ncbi:uncharacterized protein LOC126894445 [Daktulosphaira vitifoliae]|uniref:uncharacterized protein LOC126894445 n=1 Tax=Daktulosphaira vitifoliae TaxID=58002 RepID=UPI0021AAF970|nr:uncharacterized protein LOC126894445 [Daktulosphaira vitifoliae]
MWMTGAKQYLSFDVPTIWRQPMCHEVDCYFCLTKIKQHGRHKTVEYAHVNSMSKPVPHSLSVKYPVCPKRKKECSESPESSNHAECKTDISFKLEKIPRLYENY